MVNGIIMLEGPDGCGKTTLARWLVKHHGAFYIHGRVHKDMWKYHVGALRMAAKLSNDRLVVIDRNWPSECVYGPVYRDTVEYHPAERSLDRVFLKHATLHVMCLPEDHEAIVERFEELKQKRIEEHPEVSEVAKRYRAMWHGDATSFSADGNYLEQLGYLGGLAKLRHDWVLYDYTKDGHDLEVVANKLLTRCAELRSQQYRPALSHEHCNVAGYLPTARLLFVGDKPGELPKNWHKLNKRRKRATIWPFFARAQSSKFLNQALHTAMWNESLAMWTNINHPDQHFSALMAQKPELKIVTMGKLARDMIVTLGYRPEMHLNHPQWERRFNYRGQKGYHLHESLSELTNDTA